MICPRRSSAKWFFAFVFFLIQLTTGVRYGIAGSNANLTSKQQMQAHHVGETVVISRADGTKLRAKIVSEGELSAVIRNAAGKNEEVSYSDVTSVRSAGLSRKATIWIVVGIGFVGLAIFGTRV